MAPRRGKGVVREKESEAKKMVMAEGKKGVKRSRKSLDKKGKGKRKRENKDTVRVVESGDSSTCSTTTTAAAGSVEDEVVGAPLFFEDSQGDGGIDGRLREREHGIKYQGKWRAVPPTRYYSENDGNVEEEVRSAEEIKISSHGDKNFPGFKHHVEACSICGSEDHSGRCFGRRCNACFKEGHLMKDCPLLQRDRRRCNLCGQLGHLRKDVGGRVGRGAGDDDFVLFVSAFCWSTVGRWA